MSNRGNWNGQRDCWFHPRGSIQSHITVRLKTRFQTPIHISCSFLTATGYRHIKPSCYIWFINIYICTLWSSRVHNAHLNYIHLKIEIPSTYFWIVILRLQDLAMQCLHQYFKMEYFESRQQESEVLTIKGHSINLFRTHILHSIWLRCRRRFTVDIENFFSDISKITIFKNFLNF